MTTYTPEELAEILKVSVKTIYRMLNSGELPGTKVRGQWRTSERGLEKVFKHEELPVNRIL